MNTPGRIPDGNYWSPDGGFFTAKGDRIFWEDGEIADNPMGGPCRMIPAANGSDCSQMTDTERAAKRASLKQAREECAKEAAIWLEAQDKLTASAKAKLTAAEYAACLQEGRDQ